MNYYRRHDNRKLLTIIAICAAIVLALALVCLVIVENYTASSEKSQPQNVIDAYLYNLDAKHIQNHCSELIASINPEVQSEKDCLKIIADAIDSDITAEFNADESTESKMVYKLISNANTIGNIVLTKQGKGAFGFARWEVSEESYDFSFLLKESETFNVPEHYKVYVNGKLLSQRSVIQQDMPIEVLKDFYADYNTLPYMVTYEVGPYLGDIEIAITDAEDKPVTAEQAEDIAFILDNCSDAEKDTLDYLVDDYIVSYVRFTSNADKTLEKNYEDVISYVVPESALAQQLEDMQEALKDAPNQQVSISSKTVRYRTRLAGGLYLYDISYELSVDDTTATENSRLLLSQTPEGLKVERMLSY